MRGVCRAGAFGLAGLQDAENMVASHRTCLTISSGLGAHRWDGCRSAKLLAISIYAVSQSSAVCDVAWLGLRRTGGPRR
jgi:hypothetical protein